MSAEPITHHGAARAELFWHWLTAPADMPRDEQLALLDRWTAADAGESSVSEPTR